MAIYGQVNTGFVKQLQFERNISDTKLAEIIGVSRQSLYAKLRNPQTFKATELYAISTYFDIPMDKFIIGEQNVKAMNVLQRQEDAKDFTLTEEQKNSMIEFLKRNPSIIFNRLSGTAYLFDWEKERDYLIDLKRTFNISWSKLWLIFYNISLELN